VPAEVVQDVRTTDPCGDLVLALPGEHREAENLFGDDERLVQTAEQAEELGPFGEGVGAAALTEVTEPLVHGVDVDRGSQADGREGAARADPCRHGSRVARFTGTVGQVGLLAVVGREGHRFEGSRGLPGAVGATRSGCAGAGVRKRPRDDERPAVPERDGPFGRGVDQEAEPMAAAAATPM
jgi:hypothetical protein